MAVGRGSVSLALVLALGSGSGCGSGSGGWGLNRDGKGRAGSYWVVPDFKGSGDLVDVYLCVAFCELCSNPARSSNEPKSSRLPSCGPSRNKVCLFSVSPFPFSLCDPLSALFDTLYFLDNPHLTLRFSWFLRVGHHLYHYHTMAWTFHELGPSPTPVFLDLFIYSVHAFLHQVPYSSIQ